MGLYDFDFSSIAKDNPHLRLESAIREFNKSKTYETMLAIQLAERDVQAEASINRRLIHECS